MKDDINFERQAIHPENVCTLAARIRQDLEDDRTLLRQIQVWLVAHGNVVPPAPGNTDVGARRRWQNYIMQCDDALRLLAETRMTLLALVPLE